MSTETDHSCGRADTLRDYAFDELTAADRLAFERHLSTCEQCAQELDSLRLTTAALRVAPDREIPQRIAFVSDPVITRPRWGWLSFASACVLALAILIAAWRLPPVVTSTVAQVAPAAASASQDVSKQVNEAVALAVSKARAEDARQLNTVVQQLNEQYQINRAQMVAVEERMDVMQKHYGLNTILASADAGRTGDGQ